MSCHKVPIYASLTEGVGVPLAVPLGSLEVPRSACVLGAKSPESPRTLELLEERS